MTTFSFALWGAGEFSPLARNLSMYGEGSYLGARSCGATLVTLKTDACGDDRWTHEETNWPDGADGNGARAAGAGCGSTRGSPRGGMGRLCAVGRPCVHGCRGATGFEGGRGTSMAANLDLALGRVSPWRHVSFSGRRREDRRRHLWWDGVSELHGHGLVCARGCDERGGRLFRSCDAQWSSPHRTVPWQLGASNHHVRDPARRLGPEQQRCDYFPSINAVRCAVCSAVAFGSGSRRHARPGSGPSVTSIFISRSRRATSTEILSPGLY